MKGLQLNQQRANLMANIETKVILVGIGGASCSGKTTLAHHLRRILPDSIIVHQDDFYMPEEKVPIYHGLDTKNWDSPDAINWSQMLNVLQDVKRTGSIPSDHISGHSVEDSPIDDNRAITWKAHFEDMKQRCLLIDNVKLIWVIVEGFMLYWDLSVVHQLDICVFLRLPEHILKERREIRDGPLGHSAWIDPEGYWDNICYPEYIERHKSLFQGGDVENGAPKDLEDWGKALLLVESKVKGKVDVMDVVEVCLEKIVGCSVVTA